MNDSDVYRKKYKREYSIEQKVENFGYLYKIVGIGDVDVCGERLIYIDGY